MADHPVVNGQADGDGAGVAAEGTPVTHHGGPWARSLPVCFLAGRIMIGGLLQDRIEETGLSAVDALVLRAVSLNRAMCLGDIRSAFALPPSSVTRVVDRLTEHRLARRDADIEDGRLVTVRLTGPGQAVADMVDNAVRELEREIGEQAGSVVTGIDAVVDAIELIGHRDRALRRRHW